MYFYKFKSDKQINVNLNKYKIDWGNPPSKEQGVLEDFLYPYLKNKFVLREFMIPGCKFRFDIMVIDNRWIFEYSPDSTHDFNPFFHNRATFCRRVTADLDKIDWAKRHNFNVAEIKKEDLSCLSRRFFVDNFGILL